MGGAEELKSCLAEVRGSRGGYLREGGTALVRGLRVMTGVAGRNCGPLSRSDLPRRPSVYFLALLDTLRFPFLSSLLAEPREPRSC